MPPAASDPTKFRSVACKKFARNGHCVFGAYRSARARACVRSRAGVFVGVCLGACVRVCVSLLWL